MDVFEEQFQLEDTYVMHTYGRKPIEFVQGKGMRLVDSTGKTYFDFLSGIGTVSLGHCHPVLVDALQRQSQQLMHVSNFFYVEGRGEVSKQLSGLLNECAHEHAEPWASFFANSGAEANECAIKLARLWGKKSGNGDLIVALSKSFHGRTLSTLSATGQPSKQEAFKPLPGGFIHTDLNDEVALRELFEAQGAHICAVMVECVQGESGVNPCSKEFLQAVKTLADEYGALLICDEIQCGMYRCGTYPFAYQHYAIMPDIVTMAKGIASGFPTGVCSARAEIAAAFEPGDHGSTFGGSCLAITAIQATLDTFKQENIASSVAEVGSYLRDQLALLPGVVQVRGRGLMCACDVDESIDASAIVNEGLTAGFVFNNTGPHTLRFLPPLICTKKDVDALIESLAQLLA